MRTNLFTAAAAGAFCLGMAAPRPAVAQSLHELLARSDSLVEAGAFAEARAWLAPLDTLCAAGSAGTDCRAMLEVERGFVAHREASQAAERGPLLAEATERYRAALREAPGDEDALYNLALALDQTDPAQLDTVLLKNLRRSDTTRVGLYDRLRGDQALATGRERVAVELYFRALDGPGGVGALADLITLAERGVVPTQRLLARLRATEASNPALAADGYLAVALASSSPGVKRDALMRWAWTRAASGTLDSAAVAALPEQADPEVAGWLRDKVGSRCPGDDPEWLSQPNDRAEVLTLVAVDQGRRRIDAGEPEAAFACWSRTFPHAMGTPALDLASELASLIHQHPDYDPESQWFREIEDRLFGGKGGAIARDDTAAVERMHTTLGLIYAERETENVEAPDPRASHTARVQLERALAAAARRDAASGVRRPLPYLRIRLAEAYRRAGRAAAADTAFVRAAEEYLELDALPEAQAALAQVASSAVSSRAAQVSRFLEARNRVARLLDAEDQEAPERTCTREILASAVPGRTDFAVSDATVPAPWSGDPFLTRQRFKLLADCAGLSGSRNQRLYAAEAVQMIVAGTELRPLAGAADMERLERVLDIVAAATSDGSVETRISEAPVEGAASADSASVGIGAGTNTVFVVVPTNTLLAAQALRVFAWLNLTHPFYVEGDTVVIEGDVDEDILEQAQARLRRLTRSSTVVRRQLAPDPRAGT